MPCCGRGRDKERGPINEEAKWDYIVSCRVAREARMVVLTIADPDRLYVLVMEDQTLLLLVVVSFAHQRRRLRCRHIYCRQPPRLQQVVQPSQPDH